MNKSTYIFYDFEYDVLIDTWWNVNITIVRFAVSQSQVLIDTWWNVNYDEGYTEKTLKRVLIDTWWNVNICKYSVSILPIQF